MTIKELIIDIMDEINPDTESGKAELDAVFQNQHLWSNAACIGYCKEAMNQAGIDMNTQISILTALIPLFDQMSVSDAEKILK